MSGRRGPERSSTALAHLLSAVPPGKAPAPDGARQGDPPQGRRLGFSVFAFLSSETTGLSHRVLTAVRTSQVTDTYTNAKYKSLQCGPELFFNF